MATKITKTVDGVEEENLIKKISKEDMDEANKKIYQTYGMLGAVDPVTKKEIIESPDHFIGGIVPTGFRKTYGDEITETTEGNVGEVMEIINSIFNKEDGFRVFLKYLDGNVLTILLPIKFAKNDPSYDQLYMHIMKCDCRSVVLRPGNLNQQVETFAKRIARRIGYQRGR